MMKLLLRNIFFLILFVNLPSDLFSQDINYYQLEESGYFTNPVQTPHGVICTDNYSSRIYLILNDKIEVLVESPGCGRYFSVSMDGSLLGYKLIDDSGQIPHIYDLINRSDIELDSPKGICGQPCFDSYSNIYFTIEDSLIVISKDSRKNFYLGSYSNIVEPSSEGERVVFTNSKGSLSILHLNTGKPVELKSTKSCLYPVWSKDGLKLAFNSINGLLFIWDFDSDEIIELGSGGSPSWTDDSSNLIYQYVERDKSVISSDIYNYDIKDKVKTNLTNSGSIVELNPSISDNTILFQTHNEREVCMASFDIKLKSISDVSTVYTWNDDSKIKFYALIKSRDYVTLDESPYVNQMYDTPDFHDGSGSCGPTTAIMTLAYYNRLPEWPTEINKLTPHVNNYGSYISDKYHFNEYFYDAYTSPYGSDSWGGYSYMWSGSGSPNSTMADYYENHLIETAQSWTSSCSFETTVNEINNGFPQTICAYMTVSGHILMAKGYNEQNHSLLFHDPFGNKNTPGYPSYDGNNVIYDWPGYNNGNQNLDADGTHGGVAWTIKTQSEVPFYNDTIVDDMDFESGFYIYNAPPSHMKYFRDQDEGYNDHSWWTITIDTEDVCYVSWEPSISEAGLYEVSTYIPEDNANAQNCMYKLSLSGLDTTVTINQDEYNNDWVLLGWFNLHPDSINRISLGDSTGVYGEIMAFDAMKFSRAQTVGIDENEFSESEVKIFPNPASDLVRVSLPELQVNDYITIEVYNTNLQLVDRLNINNTHDIEIPVSGYNNGSYLLKILTKDDIYYSRFVVIH